MRAAPQGRRGRLSDDAATAHFSQEYMHVVLQDVQKALAAAGRGPAAPVFTAVTALSTQLQAAERQPSTSAEVLSAKAGSASTLSNAAAEEQMVDAATGNDDSNTGDHTARKLWAPGMGCSFATI